MTEAKPTLAERSIAYHLRFIGRELVELYNKPMGERVIEAADAIEARDQEIAKLREALKLVERDLDIPGMPFCTLDTAIAVREALAATESPQ